MKTNHKKSIHIAKHRVLNYDKNFLCPPIITDNYIKDIDKIKKVDT